MRRSRLWSRAVGIGALVVASSGTLALGETPQKPASTEPGKPQAARSAEPATPVDPLITSIDEVVEITKRRELDAKVHTPWQILHGVVGMRNDFIIRVGDQRMPAVEWFRTQNATYNGEPYFEATEFGGRGHPFTKPMLFEGHPNQFLAYLTMCRLPLDARIHAGDKTLTVQDLVRGTQKEVRAGEEPGWTLWALSHYLDLDATWENKQGEAWSIERLVRSQVYENANTAACGGTHGLFALAYAMHQYRQTGRPLRGVWLEADQKLRRYIEEAKSLQNPDFSFSMDFFKGRRAAKTIDERLGPSGHTLEFLAIALPQERLTDQWFRNAIHATCLDLKKSESQPLSVAPLYHAVNGLLIFKERSLRRTLPPGHLATTTADTSP